MRGSSPRMTWDAMKRLDVRWPLHHDAQPFRGARDAGVEPSRPAVLERKTLVEQHHVVPLRALRLVHGEHIAVVELVIGLALLPRDRVDAALEAIVAYRDLGDLVAELLVGREPHGQDF